MTTTPSVSIDRLSDDDLLSQIRCAAQSERHATVHLIELLMELDSRRLYLGEGFSSLFTFCTQALHLSEHAAYNRIETARTARRFPIILELVTEGALTLTSVRLLGPHLTLENHTAVLEHARQKSKRQVELLVASLNPRPDVPSAIRKLPERRPLAEKPVAVEDAPRETPAGEASGMSAATAVPARRSITPHSEVKPLAPERYKVQFTVSGDTYEKFCRDRPQPKQHANSISRYVPAAVKRSVWQRDGARCAFSGSNGRCTETAFLEYHHVVPFAAGGKASAENLELRCRAHNQHEADLYFGDSNGFLLRESHPLYGASW